MKKPLLKAIALFLVAGFSAQEISWAASAAPELLAPKKLWQAPGSVTVPPEFGHIRQTHIGQSPKLLIHIQDAHSNFSAQRNIAGILDALIRRHDIRMVFAEGGTRDDSLTFLRSLAPAAVRERVGEQYLRKGELSGAEYLSLASDHPMKLIGVEDEALYLDNLKAYSGISLIREDALSYLSEVSKRVSLLKRRMFPPSVLKLDELSEAFEKKETGFTDYHEALHAEAKRSGVNLLGVPHFLSLSELRAMEARIDFQKASAEQARLFKAFPPEDPLAVQTPHKAGGATRPAAAFYEAWLARAKKAGARDEDSAELALYTGYLKRCEALDVQRLSDELDEVREAVFEKGLRDADSLRLHAVAEHLRNLKTLFSLGAAREDFAAYLGRKSDEGFHTAVFLGFLNRKLLDHGLDADALSYEASIETDLKKIEDFYRTTAERDEVMVRKSLEAMEKEGLSAAVLITGGYHTENLKTLLEKEDVSYLVVSPLVTEETNLNRYEKILLSELGTETGKEREPAAFAGRNLKERLAVERTVLGTIPGIRAAFGEPMAVVPAGSRLAASRRPQKKEESAGLSRRNFFLLTAGAIGGLVVAGKVFGPKAKKHEMNLTVEEGPFGYVSQSYYSGEFTRLAVVPIFDGTEKKQSLAAPIDLSEGDEIEFKIAGIEDNAGEFIFRVFLEGEPRSVYEPEIPQLWQGRVGAENGGLVRFEVQKDYRIAGISVIRTGPGAPTESLGIESIRLFLTKPPAASGSRLTTSSTVSKNSILEQMDRVISGALLIPSDVRTELRTIRGEIQAGDFLRAASNLDILAGRYSQARKVPVAAIRSVAENLRALPAVALPRSRVSGARLAGFEHVWPLDSDTRLVVREAGVEDLEDVWTIQTQSPANKKLWLSRDEIHDLLASPHGQVLIAVGEHLGKSGALGAVFTSVSDGFETYADAKNPAKYDPAGKSMYDFWIIARKDAGLGADIPGVADKLILSSKEKAEKDGRTVVAYSRAAGAWASLSETDRSDEKLMNNPAWRAKKILQYLMTISNGVDPGPQGTAPFMGWLASRYEVDPEDGSVLSQKFKEILDPSRNPISWNPADDQPFVRLLGLLLRQYVNEERFLPSDVTIGRLHMRVGAHMQRLRIDSRPSDTTGLGSNIEMSYETIPNLQEAIDVLLKPQRRPGVLVKSVYLDESVPAKENGEGYGKVQKAVWYRHNMNHTFGPARKANDLLALRLNENSVVLDASTGSAAGSLEMMRRLTRTSRRIKKLIAVDVDFPTAEQMIDYAARVLKPFMGSLIGSNEFFILPFDKQAKSYAPVSEISGILGTVDVALFMNAIHLVEPHQRESFFKGLFDVLKPGGALFIGSGGLDDPSRPAHTVILDSRFGAVNDKIIEIVNREAQYGSIRAQVNEDNARPESVKSRAAFLSPKQLKEVVDSLHAAGFEIEKLSTHETVLKRDDFRQFIIGVPDYVRMAFPAIANLDEKLKKQILRQAYEEVFDQAPDNQFQIWWTTVIAQKPAGSRLAVLERTDQGRFTPDGRPIVLIAEDDKDVQYMYELLLRDFDEGTQFVLVEHLDAAWTALEIAKSSGHLRLVVTDNRFPTGTAHVDAGKTSGQMFFEALTREQFPVIMASNDPSAPEGVPAEFFFDKINMRLITEHIQQVLLPSSKDMGTTGARLAAALKPRSQTLVPVLLSALTLFTLTPAEANQVSVRASEISNLKTLEGETVWSGTVDLKSRPTADGARLTTAVKQPREYVQDIRGSDEMLKMLLPVAAVDRASVPAALKVPLTLLSSIEDADYFEAQFLDLLQSIVQYHGSLGRNDRFYLHGRLNDAQLLIVREAIEEYGSFVHFGEEPSVGMPVVRLIDASEEGKDDAPDGTLHFPTSRVEQDTLAGWFGQIYIAMTAVKYFARDGKLDVSNIKPEEVPSEILDAFEQRAEAKPDPATFVEIASGRAKYAVLARFRFKPIAAVPLNQILKVLEAARRSILGSA